MALYQLDPNTPYFKVRFVAEVGLITDGISIVTRAPWHRGATHVDIVTDTSTLIGAHASGGIQERPEGYMKHIHWERRYAIPLSHKEQAAALLADARAAIGTKYDFLDIAGLLFQTGWHNPKKEICSEFVFQVAARRGLMMLNTLPERGYLIDPDRLHLSKDLLNHCYYEQIHS